MVQPSLINTEDEALSKSFGKSKSTCRRPLTAKTKPPTFNLKKMGERFKNQNKSFVCTFSNCKASFSKSWKLEAHYCKHTGLKPFACDSCDKSFCTRCQLTRHKLSHTGEKPYRCSEDGCTESFSSGAGLKNHVARVHKHIKKHYVCDYEDCGKAFNKNKQLKAHKCEHTNQLPYECQYENCGKKFVTFKTLKKHEKVHDGYPCAEEGCTFQGKTWTEYQVHRKAAHREILQCDSCPKVFHEAWFLKKHKQFAHLGARPVFKCTRVGCERTFTTHFNLQSHILSFHEGQRSFICAHAGCGKAFAMEESLKRHGVVHDPQKKKLQKKTKPRRKKRKSKANVSNVSELSACLQKVTLNKSRPQQPPKP